MSDGRVEIRLRPFIKSDIKRLIGWIDSPEFLVQWAGKGLSYPLDEPQLLNLLEKTCEAEPSLMMFATLLTDTGEAMGHVQLSNINRTDRSAAVARVLVGPKNLRNKGLGKKIVEAALEVGFRKLGLHRIYLNVFDFNHGAIACYEKVGFRKEGLSRDTVRMGTKYWSHLTMSILEDEWHSIVDQTTKSKNTSTH